MHTTKRAVLLSCSDHYNHRLYVIDGYLRSLGYETVYYTSDFDHTSKKVFRCTVPGCRQIHVRPYQKNLSLSRILSHRDFARLVFQELEQDPPDVVVAQLPPNYLAHYAARFKARAPGNQADLRDFRHVAGDLPLRLHEAPAGPALFRVGRSAG